jgi:23S rRNA (uracil1939-C5)-methyltransferase
VTLNLQPKRSNLILGAETRLLGGSPCIEERFCGLSLSLGTTTFFPSTSSLSGSGGL